MEKGVGIAMLPDYMVAPEWHLVAMLPEYEVPSYDCFFVYPEELRESARVTVFRDFLLANARRLELLAPAARRKSLAGTPGPGWLCLRLQFTLKTTCRCPASGPKRLRIISSTSNSASPNA